MIQQRTIAKVLDNSGAKTLRCIKVLGGFKKKTARVGDLIVGSVLTLRNKDVAKITKGDTVRAIVIKTKTKQKKKDGSFFLLGENSVLLISKQGTPFGTRILRPISKALKKKRLLKFVSLSPGTF